jgi:hypothetical protein
MANTGRPKGSLNKFTRAFKDAVLLCFQSIGGDPAFARWAKKNPGEFYKIAARLIPTEVIGDRERPIGVKVTFGGRYRATGDKS